MTKNSIFFSSGILVCLVVIALLFFFLYSSPEFPTVGRFKPLVPSSDTWPTIEKKDDAGRLIYSLRMPAPTDDERDPGYVGIGGDEFLQLAMLNKISVSTSPVPSNINNIDDYELPYVERLREEDPRIAGYIGSSEATIIGPYRAWRTVSSDYDLIKHRTTVSILSKGYVIDIMLDYPNGCLDWNPGDPVQKGDSIESLTACKEYFGVYIPIVKKILSSLSVPQYVDDRGPAPTMSLDVLFQEMKNR